MVLYSLFLRKYLQLVIWRLLLFLYVAYKLTSLSNSKLCLNVVDCTQIKNKVAVTDALLSIQNYYWPYNTFNIGVITIDKISAWIWKTFCYKNMVFVLHINLHYDKIKWLRILKKVWYFDLIWCFIIRVISYITFIYNNC